MSFVTDLLASLGATDASMAQDYSGAAADKVLNPESHLNDGTPDIDMPSTRIPAESGNKGWSIQELLDAIGNVGGSPFASGGGLAATPVNRNATPDQDSNGGDDEAVQQHAQNMLKFQQDTKSRADADIQARLDSLRSASGANTALYAAKGNNIISENTDNHPVQSNNYDSTSRTTQDYTPAGEGSFSHSLRPIPEQLAIAQLAQQKVEPAISGALIDNGGLNGARQALLSLAQQQAEPMSQKIMRVIGVGAGMKNPAQAKLFMTAGLRSLSIPDADIARILSSLPSNTPNQ